MHCRRGEPGAPADLERRLAWAATRTVVQLLLVGYIHKWVFDLDHPAALAPVLTVMIVAAGLSAVRRPSRTFSGATWRACITLLICGLTTTFAVTHLVVGVTPWYRPQYVIPLLA